MVSLVYGQRCHAVLSYIEKDFSLNLNRSLERLPDNSLSTTVVDFNLFISSLKHSNQE